jgi:bifunctional non-homologous end joining protein LigD
VNRRFGRRTVELTHPDRVLFPDAGLTKADLVDYYEAVAEPFLRALRDRPLTLRCFPEGIEGDGFHRQQPDESFPDWIRTARRTRAEGGGSIDRLLCGSRAELAFLVNQNAVEFHCGLARAPRLDRCDRIILDLDPPGEDFEAVRQAARRVLAPLEQAGIRAGLMTTGSRGLHVTIPLRPEHDHDRVRAVARAFAERLAEAHPDRLTVAARKAERGERLYLDVMRVGLGQTGVAPYSLRARPGAPVATPITREELEDPALHARRWDHASVRERLARKGDPWKGLARHAVRLDTLARALDIQEGS